MTDVFSFFCAPGLMSGNRYMTPAASSSAAVPIVQNGRDQWETASQLPIDLVGTTLSGWLTDRFDSRWLLFWYYGLRGLSLIYLPQALGLGPANLMVFAVFYGLDWIATVPPTVRLASDSFGKERSGMIFGWIVVAHQLAASAAAFEAGVLREWLGSYTVPFVLAGIICLLAAAFSVRIRNDKKRSASSFAG